MFVKKFKKSIKLNDLKKKNLIILMIHFANQILDDTKVSLIVSNIIFYGCLFDNFCIFVYSNIKIFVNFC